MGLFITVEGGEGSGKSTLIRKLYDYLTVEENRKVEKTFEPGATPLGVKIRGLVLDQEEIAISPRAELLLFLADRAHHVETVIRPALKEGKVVLCDRFTDSSLAYQGGARSIENLEEICFFATSGITPDITFFLDVDPLIAFERLKRKKDRVEKEKIDFHRKVRQEYLRIANKEKERVVVLDASRTEEERFQEALFKVKDGLFRICPL